LFVSESWEFRVPGPGVLCFEPDGTGSVWHEGPFDFANGLAFNADCTVLYVAETFGQSIAAVEVCPDGSAGATSQYANLPDCYPDGLAVAEDGSLIVGCYQPSKVLRVRPDREVELVGEDISAHVLAHPTNIAFQGDTLITANLGRWHLTRIELGLHGLPLPPRPTPLPAGVQP
jgi:sugar lactone lactonase YvrE